MLNQKGSTFLAIVIGVFLVLAIGGFYYFSTQKNNSSALQTSLPSPKPNPSVTTSPKSDWKLVTENDYSFEIPSSWILRPNSSEYTSFDPTKTDNNNSDLLKFSVSHESTNQSLSDYVKSQMQSPEIKGYGGPNFSTKNLTVASQPAVRFVMGTSPQLVFIKNPNKLEILSLNFYFDVEKYGDIYNHILSSFKFIK